MRLQVDQQIIFGPNNHSTRSITMLAVERIPSELGLTCTTGPFRIMAKIVKNSGPVGLGYSITLLVKCQRVNVASDKDHVTLVVLWPRIMLQGDHLKTVGDKSNLSSTWKSLVSPWLQTWHRVNSLKNFFFSRQMSKFDFCKEFYSGLDLVCV